VTTTMIQRLKLLKDVLGLYLNRHKGVALLERLQASDLSDEDRAHVSHIMRTMLKLHDPGQESSAPEASAPAAHASRRRQRRSS
jgi:hypothetical protein